MKLTKINFLLIVALLSFLLGTWIRFHYAFSTELWGDEAMSYFFAKDTSWYDLLFSTGTYWDKVHPPTYYLFLKLMLFFSHQDWWLRLTSVIWFFPSALLVFRIGKLLKDSAAGLLALSFFSLHPLLASLSFQVRPYPIGIFVSLLYIYFLIKVLTKPRLKYSLLLGFFAGTSFLLIYSNALVFLNMLVFIPILLIYKKIAILKHMLLSLAVSLLLILPQLIILVSFLLSKSTGNYIAGSVLLTDSVWIFSQLEMLFGNPRVWLSLVVSLVALILLLMRRRTLVNEFLAFSLFGTILFSIAISYFSFPVFLARQLFVFTLILMFVFSQLNINWRQLALVFLLLFFLGKASFQGRYFIFTKNTSANIQQKINNDGVILTFGSIDHIKYYLSLQEKNNLVFTISPNFNNNKNLVRQFLVAPALKITFLEEGTGLYQDDHYIYQETLDLLTKTLCYKHSCEKISFLE